MNNFKNLVLQAKYDILIKLIENALILERK